MAATIQCVLGLAFAAAALALRAPLEEELLDGSATLYWTLIVAVLAYAASYFARGFLAGHRRFGLYGALLLLEAGSRFLFAAAVLGGIASGQSFVALGMAAAPIASLGVLGWASSRRSMAVAEPDGHEAAEHAHADEADRRLPLAFEAAEAVEPRADRQEEADFTLSHGGGFAAAVLVVMLSEQAFLNAGPLLVKATDDIHGAALAGFVFNVLLIARAPLQLFHAVQTSILPHLTKLRASGHVESFRRSVSLTLAAIVGFAALLASIMLAAGPFLMELLFGDDFQYPRGGLVLISLGMGFYLAAATLSQAALARRRARSAAACWASAAIAFVGFLALVRFDDRLLQVEAGFLGAAGLLFGLLFAVYRRGDTGA